jgi:hypothetical protein
MSTFAKIAQNNNNRAKALITSHYFSVGFIQRQLILRIKWTSVPFH